MLDSLKSEIRATTDLVDALAFLERVAAPVAVLSIVSGRLSGTLWIVDGKRISFGKVSSGTGGLEDIFTLLSTRNGMFELELSREKPPSCEMDINVNELFSDRTALLAKIRKYIESDDQQRSELDNLKVSGNLSERIFRVIEERDLDEQNQKRLRESLPPPAPVEEEEAPAEDDKEERYVTKAYFKSAFARKAAELGHDKLMEGRLTVEADSESLQLTGKDITDTTHELATVAKIRRRIAAKINKKFVASVCVMLSVGALVLVYLIDQARERSKQDVAEQMEVIAVTEGEVKSKSPLVQSQGAAAPVNQPLPEVSNGNTGASSTSISVKPALTRAEKADVAQELQRGAEYLRRLQLDNAIQVYSSLVRKYPNDVRFRLILAHTYRAAERYSESKAVCQEGMNLASGRDFEVLNRLLKELP